MQPPTVAPSRDGETARRRRPVDDLRTIREAVADGVADGLRRHLPGGVGIIIKGCALGSVCAFLHLVVGFDVSTTLVSGAVGGGGLIAATRRWDRP